MTREAQGDFRRNRLFLDADSAFGFDHPNVKQIKHNVFFVSTNRKHYVIKGYTNQAAARRQWHLAKALKSEGFHRGLEYRRFPSGSYVVKTEGMYWLSMKRLPQKRPVHFQNGKDREKAGDLLHAFHGVIQTQNNVQLPDYSLLKHWEKRFDQFCKEDSLYTLAEVIGKKRAKEALRWGDIALSKLRRYRLYELEEKAKSRGQAIHRDTAAHNFILTPDDSLHMIDFDLAASAPEAYDWLQLSLRYMPWMQWSLNALGKERYIRSFLQKKWFLTGLLYPADLYRDWNAAMKENNSRSFDWFASIHSIEHRVSYFDEISRQLESPSLKST
ncbi:phosphotransferase [Aureibacillus halotolerans]|uniref:Phosphotransferase family enzyme n=1 Tax=Aureibacillus halotolerans TaxID=1508390 RepID=A0A4V3D4X8_9BACI|nr:phosphotransferase [Aureibacillus halotolerans]TDQ37977.1 phosphotransferase family enzyme [Aureibacillus halotolerans]